MKAVIFAGGVGTRLWPLSRKKSPKQFEKIIGNKSTLQLAVDRLLSKFSPKDIFISTGKAYVDLVSDQLSAIPKQNIIGEPVKKDVGPAVAVVMGYLAQRFPDEPVVILWSDHLVKHENTFMKLIQAASTFVSEKKDAIVFIGQKPRFASENLGWIERTDTYQTVEDTHLHAFHSFKYKPDKDLAEKYFADPHYCWNLGYFVSTPAFVTQLFARFAPAIDHVTQRIVSADTREAFTQALGTFYEEMPEISFDNAVLEQLDPKQAFVIVDDIGWSDVGAWEALKEALEEEKTDNITKGNVFLQDASDNLVYNYQDGKLVVGIDLEEHLIVNTHDVLLVAKKSSVPKIKKIVENFEGTEHEKLT